MKLKASLRQRIFLNLFALLAITLAGGGFTIWYVSWMDTLFTSITGTDLRGVEAASELESQLAEQKGYVTYYFLDRDPNWLAMLDKHRNLFEVWLARTREVSEAPAARAILNGIESSYIRYIEGRDRVIELYQLGETDAGQAIHRQVREQYFAINKLCEELKAIHRKNIEEARAKGRERVRIVNGAALTIMPVAFILSIVLAAILTRQVLGPIRRLALGSGTGPEVMNETPFLDEVAALDWRVQSLLDDVDRTNTELALSQSHLMQSEKLALVGKMAAGVAHSVRNPLTSVKMRLFSLKRSLALSPIQQEDFEVISEEIRHIDTILQNFLEFSRPPKLKVQEISPSDIVDMALQLMRHRLESYRVEVVLKRLEPLPEIMVDPEQLKELFVNLLVNACEAMVDGGRIVIRELEDVDDDLGRVEIVRISDSGPGVPADAVARVFDPFFTTKEQGTGLGLSIARRIVEEHGGRIELASTEGRGSTFTILLPVHRARGGT
jgi:signal transduction histidine kinase